MCGCMHIGNILWKTNSIKIRAGLLFVIFSLMLLIQTAISANSTSVSGAPLSHSISVLQYTDKMEASAVGENIDGDSWRNNYAVAGTSDPDCSQTTFGAASSSANDCCY